MHKLYPPLIFLKPQVLWDINTSNCKCTSLLPSGIIAYIAVGTVRNIHAVHFAEQIPKLPGKCIFSDTEFKFWLYLSTEVKTFGLILTDTRFTFLREKDQNKEFIWV